MEKDDKAIGSDRSTDELPWTQEEETAVRRKLDKVIVPLTTFLYLLCFLDRYVTQLKRSRCSLISITVPMSVMVCMLYLDYIQDGK